MSYRQYYKAGAAADGGFEPTSRGVDEEMEAELMKLLEAHGSPPPAPVRFTDDPYSFAVLFQSSSDYVTINGNEERSGSSYSYSDSSVMASIDCGGASGMRHGEWWLAAARRCEVGGG